VKRASFILSLSSSSLAALMACGGKKSPEPTTAPTTAAPTATAAPTTATTATTAPADDASAPTTAPAEDASSADAAPTGPTPACAAFGQLAVDYAALAGDVLTVCGEAASKGWCFEVTLASGAVVGKELPEDDVTHVTNVPAAVADPFHRKDGSPALQLCLDASTGCKDVFAGDVLAAWIGPDKKSFAVTTLEDKQKHVRLYDGATYSETADHVIEKDVDLPDCSFAAPLSSGVVLVATGPCTGSAGRHAWLMDGASGAKIADVGGADGFDVRLGGFLAIEADRWAFRDDGGQKIVVQDVKSGEVKATADLSKLAAKDTPAWLFLAGEPARLLAVENRPGPGATLVIDPATGQVERSVTPDACAAPTP